MRIRKVVFSFFFFFNDTATTEIYTLSLHDALPISILPFGHASPSPQNAKIIYTSARILGDRKSTRLNSSHSQISYAVFCLKKKNTLHHQTHFALPVILRRLPHHHPLHTP